MFYDPRTEPHGLAHTPVNAAAKPLVDFLNSIQTKVDGATATTTGMLKGSPANIVMLFMLMESR